MKTFTDKCISVVGMAIAAIVTAVGLALLISTGAKALRGEELPMALGMDLTQGPVTVQCNVVDYSSFPLILRLFADHKLECAIATTAPDTAAFDVTIQTSDGGKVTTTTNRTTAQAARSMVILPATKDTVLLGVQVQEVKPVLKFGAAQ